MTRYEAVVQDRFVTEREGRWVLPVRSDAHERFPGIVHATSGSGATLFVEPRAVVPMGNRLKVLEAEVQREEEAVYARLTAARGDALRASRRPRARARARRRARGHRQAGARTSTSCSPSRRRARARPGRARHPLLALELGHARRRRATCAIEAGRAIVVSGPNAGGKTVALKTMGLAALCSAQGSRSRAPTGSSSGSSTSCSPTSATTRASSKNLSTFSAHVQNLAEILRRDAAGRAGPPRRARRRDRPARRRGARGRRPRLALRARRRGRRDDPLRGAQGARARRRALPERQRRRSTSRR